MNSWLLVAVVVLLAVHGIPAFFKGGSGDPEILAAIGSTHAREYVQWSYAEPQLDSLETNLTVAWLRAHPEAIDEYSATLSWKNCDSRVNGLVSRNITPIIEVGEGTTHCLPKYKEDVADPNVIGRDLYLAYQYRFCRAAVRRYKHVVRMWQTENELNEAWLEGFAGQRRFAVTGAWHDWKFLTEVRRTASVSCVLMMDDSCCRPLCGRSRTKIQQRSLQPISIRRFSTLHDADYLVAM